MVEKEIDLASNDGGTTAPADEAMEPHSALALPTEQAPADIELPNDYYVTLQPLTLDLAAAQLERIGVTFDRGPDRIYASWSSWVLSTVILPEQHMLSVRVRFRQPFPPESITVLAGRCNWWNSVKTFLKASVVVGIAQVDAVEEENGEGEGDGDGEGQYVPLAQVCLDFDLPLPMGVAPVQLQSLYRAIASNAAWFEEVARLDDMMPPSTWD